MPPSLRDRAHHSGPSPRQDSAVETFQKGPPPYLHIGQIQQPRQIQFRLNGPFQRRAPAGALGQDGLRQMQMRKSCLAQMFVIPHATANLTGVVQHKQVPTLLIDLRSARLRGDRGCCCSEPLIYTIPQTLGFPQSRVKQRLVCFNSIKTVQLRGCCRGKEHQAVKGSSEQAGPFHRWQVMHQDKALPCSFSRYIRLRQY